MAIPIGVKLGYYNEVQILLVGDSNEITVGSHFKKGLETLEIPCEFHSVSVAYQAPIWLKKANWWWDKRPTHLGAFSEGVLAACQEKRPDLVLTVGIAPVSAGVLKKIGQMGIKRAIFLTDDPWNPAHQNRWFFEALSNYDHVFTPRRQNLGQIEKIIQGKASYLPFGYQPDLHFEENHSVPEQGEFECDLFFAGGADAERIILFEQMAKANFRLRLYGDYWDRSDRLKGYHHGYAHPELHRKLVRDARISLCLVRRANRDGHSMRSFELAAQGGCLLVEETEEHRELFQEMDDIVPYFKTAIELIEQARGLLSNAERRRKIRERFLQWSLHKEHTYSHRVKNILEVSLG